MKVRYENMMIMAARYNDTEMPSERLARVLTEFNGIVRPVNKDLIEYTWIKNPPLDPPLIALAASIQELLPETYILNYDLREDEVAPQIHPFYIIDFYRDPTVDGMTVAGNLIINCLPGKYQPKKVLDQILDQTEEMDSILSLLSANILDLETRIKPISLRSNDLASRGVPNTASMGDHFQVYMDIMIQLFEKHGDYAYQTYCYNEAYRDAQIDIYRAWLFNNIPSAFYFDDTGRLF